MKDKNMAEIFYLPDNLLVKVENDETILETALRANISHAHICGGNARCSTCRVLVIDGIENCSQITEKEAQLAKQLNFNSTIRLACQTKTQAQVKVRRLVIDDSDIILAKQTTSNKNISYIGQEKALVILFADIRGFTSFSEKTLPYDVVHILNRYFQAVVPVINSNQGIVNNYIGDGLLALFEAKDITLACLNAIKASLDMLKAVEKLNDYLVQLYQWKIEIGIGLHYGEVVMGTIGALDKKMETVIGDAVNLASRIESANKELKTNLLISEDIYKLVSKHIVVGKVGHIALKGKKGIYELYEIIGLTES